MRSYFRISNVTTNEEVSRKFLSALESVWGLAVLAVEAFVTQLQIVKPGGLLQIIPQSEGS